MAIDYCADCGYHIWQLGEDYHIRKALRFMYIKNVVFRRVPRRLRLLAVLAILLGIYVGAILRMSSKSNPMPAVYMLSGDPRRKAWDAKKYPVCPPFYGKRGQDFEEFVKDLEPELACDIDSTGGDLLSCLRHEDTGGSDPSALPANSVAAVAAHRKRKARLYSILFRHVECPRLRDMIRSHVGEGPDAWDLLVRECRETITDLELAIMDKRWIGITMREVGISENSVWMINQHLNSINSLRPEDHRKTDDEIGLKLLQCFTNDINASLCMEAHGVRSAKVIFPHDCCTGELLGPPKEADGC